MLSKIRDKMSSWVIGVLLILVAIPLVFMGLGDYRSNQDTFAFKINDTVISTSQLEQEVFQYRQALDKNYQGNIPLIYTDKFIRSITIDYMIRTILLDQEAKAKGLVFHNDSIVESIYSTPSFRDESGFNKDKFAAQLYTLGMTPKTYESYIFQRGITNQLRDSVTETSILTKSEKRDLIKFRHHQRDVSYKIIDYNNTQKNIKITPENIKKHYDENLDKYQTPILANYDYIDIDKKNLVKKTIINKDVIKELYSKNLDDGLYTTASIYDLNHILIPNNTDKSKEIANNVYDALSKGMSFETVSLKYSTDEDTLANKGYFGEFEINDLPDYLSAVIINMKEGDISMPIESSNGIHIVSIIKKNLATKKQFEDVKDQIIKDYKNEMGTREYFDLIDEITEMNFTKKYNIVELANEFNLKIIRSKYISSSNGYGIFNFNFVREKAFDDKVLNGEETTDLIYINDDRFLILQVNEYKKREQLSLLDSKVIIESLLSKEETDLQIQNISENIRNDLNAGLIEDKSDFDRFFGTIDSDNITEEMKEIFFSSSLNIGFQTYAMDDKNYIIFAINDIIYPDDLSKIDETKDYYNFIKNTRSESEYNLFYELIKSKLDILINEDYMNAD